MLLAAIYKNYGICIPFLFAWKIAFLQKVIICKSFCNSEVFHAAQKDMQYSDNTICNAIIDLYYKYFHSQKCIYM